MNPLIDLTVALKRKKRKGLDLPKQKYFTLKQNINKHYPPPYTDN